MKITKRVSLDVTNPLDRSLLEILEAILVDQEQQDAELAELPADLLGCVERFTKRIQGHIFCLGGKDWYLFNGDCFIPVSLGVTMWAIEHLLADGLKREAELLSPVKEVNQMMLDAGFTPEELKGKKFEQKAALLEDKISGDNVKLVEFAKLMHRYTKSKKLLEQSSKCREGGLINNFLKHLPNTLGIYRQTDELNTDGHLLVCQGGTTLDLRLIDTPERMSRVSSPHDLNTYCVNTRYEPSITCPTFQAQFEHVIDNPDARSFWKMFFGTAIDGSCTKEMMGAIHATPGSGKSTLITAIRQCLGSYSTTVTDTFFLENTSRGKGDTTPHLVKIIGKRLIVAAEPKPNALLDESMIKQLTGENTVDYRDNYEKEKSFKPVCTMVMTANALPRLSGNDTAITSRRLALYQHSGGLKNSEMKKMESFSELLTSENAGILNFILEGYRMSTKFDRLPIPACMQEELTDYQHSHDPLARMFDALGIISDVLDTRKGVPIGDLFKMYQTWSEAEGEKYPLGQSAFGARLKGKGFRQGKSGSTRYWLGIHSPETKNTAPATNGHKPVTNGHKPVTNGHTPVDTSAIDAELQAIEGL